MYRITSVTVEGVTELYRCSWRKTLSLQTLDKSWLCCVASENLLNRNHLQRYGAEESGVHKIRPMNIVISGKNNTCSTGSRQEKLGY